MLKRYISCSPSLTCLDCVGQAFRSSFASLCKICFWPKNSSVRQEQCSRTEWLSSCLMGLCLPLFLSHLKTDASGFMNIFWPDSQTQTWFTGRLMKMIFFLFTEVDKFLHYLLKGYFIFQPPLPSFIFLSSSFRLNIPKQLWGCIQVVQWETQTRHCRAVPRRRGNGKLEHVIQESLLLKSFGTSRHLALPKESSTTKQQAKWGHSLHWFYHS